jgi:hypothetical protein
VQPTRAPVQLVNDAPSDNTILSSTAAAAIQNTLNGIIPGGQASLSIGTQPALANMASDPNTSFTFKVPPML